MAPDDVIPVLLLDQYKCHLMESVVHRIEDLGVQVEHIPAGVTSLCQPVDVGVNKPLKNYVRREWENYMIDKGLRTIVTKPPDRFVFSQWIIDSQAILPREVIKNSWRHAPYSYYPDEPSVQGRESPTEGASAVSAFAYTGDDDDEDEDDRVLGI